MKNQITILILSFISLSVFSQEKLDSTISENFDGTNFVLNDKNIYTYDNNYNLLIDSSFYWNLNFWDLSDLTNNDYDTDNNLTTRIDGMVGTLSNREKSDFTYNNANKITQVKNYGYSNGYLYETIEFNVNYNSNNLPTDLIVEEFDTLTSVWENIIKYEYTYDINDKIQQIINYEWDNSSTSWSPEQKEGFTISGSNITQKQYSSWNSTTSLWEIDGDTKYTYDTDNNQLTEISSSYNSTLLLFEENYKTEFVYDNAISINTIAHPFKEVFNEFLYEEIEPNNKLLSTKGYNKNGSSVWELNRKTTHHYSSYTSATPNAITDLNETSFKMFPNPATETLHFEVGKDIKLEIYNTTGQKNITQYLTQSDNKVNVTNLTNGLYYIKLSDGKNLITSSFIKK